MSHDVTAVLLLGVRLINVRLMLLREQSIREDELILAMATGNIECIDYLEMR